MGSKGRIPPPFIRRPLPVPGAGHPDPYGPGAHPPGAFPPFEMLPPLEVMEQKLAAQHLELQKLATENQRLANSQGTLRQQLVAAHHEEQILQAQIEAVKSEREQQMRSLMDKISKMEAELKAAEPVKLELQKKRSEAQNLVIARQELISRAQQLSQDLQRAHADVQQIPMLISELESLRQEFHHCRATYEYDKKLYNDHLESLQAMEKNYMSMAREVEKLRAELTNITTGDRRTADLYGSAPVKNENEGSAQPSAQNAYKDGYGVSQGHGSLPGGGAGGGVSVPSAAATVATPPYAAAQSGSAPARPGYDPSRGPLYNAQWVPAYDPERAPVYDGQKIPGYDPQRGPSYDAQRPQLYDMQRGAVGLHGQVAAANNMPYGSATPPATAASGHAASSRGHNPAQK